MDDKEKSEIVALFEKQRAFFLAHETLDVEFRKKALAALRQAVLDHRHDFYKAFDSDLGKPVKAVDVSEIGEVVSEIEFALANIDAWAAAEEVPVPDEIKPSRCYVSHEPFGVTCIIGPFNYPLNLTLTPLVGAIAGGNTCIIKPSDHTPNVSKLIEKVVAESLDERHVAIVQGGREENEVLLGLAFDMIFFTGSPTVGKVVMRAASENLTPVVLELGGKCPLVVLPDANLDQVAAQTASGRFINSGQTCIAPDYLYVHESIKSELLDRLVPTVRSMYPDLGSTGKVVTSQQVNHLKDMLDRSKGTTILGGETDADNRQMSATIVDNVDWDDSLMEEEIFGPILPVLTFRDTAEAIRAINRNHPKPLALYVFTADEAEARPFLERVQSGDAEVNGVIQHIRSPYLPFGGIGPSGMGEYHGHFGFLAFTHRKSIRIVSSEPLPV